MSTYQTEWIEEDRKRVKRLNELYDLDGRDDPNHPHAHTYTGLYQEILIYEKWANEYVVYEKWRNRLRDNLT